MVLGNKCVIRVALPLKSKNCEMTTTGDKPANLADHQLFMMLTSKAMYFSPSFPTDGSQLG